MAASKEVQDVDLESIREFKKSLICFNCKRFPRPGTNVYSCPNCNKIACSSCGYDGKTCECVRSLNGKGYYMFSHDDDLRRCPHFGGHYYVENERECTHYGGHYYSKIMAVKSERFEFMRDKNVENYVSFFKNHPCSYIVNGCNENFGGDELKVHEKSCLFRTITCPSQACSLRFSFNGILEHYQDKHSKFESREEILKFEGTIETLKNSTFILNSYGKPFFPQFVVNGKWLYVWVIGHGDIVEMSKFIAVLEFDYGNELSSTLTEIVKHIDVKSGAIDSGEFGMALSIARLTQSFDHETLEYKKSEDIQFTLKIVCEKLDEVAKDENVESGVEDTDDEKP